MPNAKDISKSISQFAIGVLILCAVIIIFSILSVGVVKLISVLYPIFVGLFALAIFAFILIILPLSFFNRLRPGLATASVIIGWIFNTTAAMFSVLVVVNYLGIGGLLLVFFLHFLSPVAVIVLLANHEGILALQLLLCWILNFGVMMYAYWLANLYDKNSAPVIDIPSEIQ